MKKFFAIVLVLALFGGIGGLGYYLYQSGTLEELGLFSTTETSGPEASVVEPEQKKKPEIGRKKPLEGEADLLDAMANEYEQNSDTVGWLEVPDTSINNSVVQSFNNTYYLRRNERRQDDTYGCYFADFDSSFGTRDQLSRNTIIYGHSDLKDDPEGRRFSQLFKFTDPEFARTHPAIRFSTYDEKMMYWKVFAVLYADSGWDYINAKPGASEFQAVVDQAKKESLYSYDVPVGEGDKILTLSTCAVKYGKSGDQRFIVMAKLMPLDYEMEATASFVKNAETTHP